MNKIKPNCDFDHIYIIEFATDMRKFIVKGTRMKTGCALVGFFILITGLSITAAGIMDGLISHSWLNSALLLIGGLAMMKVGHWILCQCSKRHYEGPRRVHVTHRPVR